MNPSMHCFNCGEFAILSSNAVRLSSFALSRELVERSKGEWASTGPARTAKRTVEKVIVELKAVKAIAPEHQAQIINYLNATGVEVGLLINFGNPKLEYKRFTRNKNMNMDKQDIQD